MKKDEGILGDIQGLIDLVPLVSGEKERYLKNFKEAGDLAAGVLKVGDEIEEEILSVSSKAAEKFSEARHSCYTMIPIIAGAADTANWHNAATYVSGLSNDICWRLHECKEELRRAMEELREAEEADLEMDTKSHIESISGGMSSNGYVPYYYPQWTNRTNISPSPPPILPPSTYTAANQQIAQAQIAQAQAQAQAQMPPWADISERRLQKSEDSAPTGIIGRAISKWNGLVGQWNKRFGRNDEDGAP